MTFLFRTFLLLVLRCGGWDFRLVATCHHDDKLTSGFVLLEMGKHLG